MSFVFPVPSDITQNEFTVNDSFTFVHEIITQNSDLYMTSLNVNALFTNIPLDGTITIRVNKKELHKSKQPTSLGLVNIDQIVVSDKFKHSDDGLLVKPL